MACGLHYDSFLKNHDPGPTHPEGTERTSFVYEELKKTDLLKKTIRLKNDPCDLECLKRVHHPEYLRLAQKEIQQGQRTLSTGDTNVSSDSWDVALRATGGALHAVDHVFSPRGSHAFCLSRPPGHHATPNKGMGFCIFNHAAVAARYAQQKHGVGKILIVDWDVHHGNGTQDIFYEDDSVFFLSTHQSPWYPGSGRTEETGTGNGLGYTLNFPFPAGSGRKEILELAFAEKLSTKMNGFKPELIIISAGFDSRKGDPLGQFNLTDKDFFDLTKLVMGLAQEHCQSRIVSILEGGYDLSGLSKAVLSHLHALIE
ncbi:MAG: histone deacetylase [Verrucomicrobia bacterium TMED40]|nr:MAG: histone deacetylase [Verrucomicrobia bacterium TMED40]|tara:strand:+ start:2482 stop:3423 length:942 start_codon:yes stop_codon:yes gene_type:complete